MDMELIFDLIIHVSITGLEMIGVLIIVLAGLRAFLSLIKSGFHFSESSLKLDFARGLELALEFKLAAEILKTVTVRTVDEFIILAAVTLLRMLISYMIHWEVKNQQEEHLNDEVLQKKMEKQIEKQIEEQIEEKIEEKLKEKYEK